MGTELYPITIKTLDLQRYLLVKTIIMIRSLRAYKNYSQEFPCEEELHIKELSDQLKDNYVYLVFPSLHRKFMMFPHGMPQSLWVIVVYEKKVAGIQEKGKDVTFILKGFYTLDSNDDDDKRLQLTLHPVDTMDEGLPVFYDNTRELLSAVDRLIGVMKSVGLEGDEWSKRLNDSRQMIISKEDGLHILHNLGFYDYAALLSTLTTAGLKESTLEEVFTTYNENLAAFAMSVVNGVYNNNPVPKKVAHSQPTKPLKSTESSEKPQAVPSPSRSEIKKTPPISSNRNTPRPNDSRHIRWQYRKKY